MLLAYHIFEFTTGLYYPSISSLKADVIPEETRAAVMTLLRIPMNLAVGVIMWHVSVVLNIGHVDGHLTHCPDPVGGRHAGFHAVLYLWYHDIGWLIPCHCLLPSLKSVH